MLLHERSEGLGEFRHLIGPQRRDRVPRLGQTLYGQFARTTYPLERTGRVTTLIQQRLGHLELNAQCA